jgi:hypothetical protein
MWGQVQEVLDFINSALAKPASTNEFFTATIIL